MINCHLIMLYVIYKQLSSSFNDMYVICIFTHKVVKFTLVLLLLHMCIYVVLANLVGDGPKESSSGCEGFDHGHF
jgi:hypothetical protein